MPLLTTPPYPEYPSGYNVVNSTVSHGLEDLFQTRHLQLTLISTAVPGVQRQYDSGTTLRRDVVDARVRLGIHFRFADTASRDMGERLTAWTLDHYFSPSTTTSKRGQAAVGPGSRLKAARAHR